LQIELPVLKTIASSKVNNVFARKAATIPPVLIASFAWIIVLFVLPVLIAKRANVAIMSLPTKLNVK